MHPLGSIAPRTAMTPTPGPDGEAYDAYNDPMAVKEAAFSGISGQGLRREFFHYRVLISPSALNEKAGQWEIRLGLATQILGDLNTVAVKHISEADAKRYFPKEYRAFTEQTEVFVDGTPLSELPGATASQLGLLALSGIQTIEQAAGISQSAAQDLGFEASLACARARTWLEHKESNAETMDQSDALHMMQEQIDRLQARLNSAEAASNAKDEALKVLRTSLGAAAPQDNPQLGVLVEDGGEDFLDQPNPLAGGDPDPDPEDLANPLA